MLPPSEGKTAPAAGPVLDLAALVAADVLTAKRERVLATLIRVAAGKQPGRALRTLGLSKGQGAELALDAALASAPCAPAATVYTGVLYERLRLPELPQSARERVLIASALWGVLSPDDPIPAYRLSIAARLPRLAPLAAFWRPALRRAIPEPDLLVDLRSGGYAAAWMPRAGTVVGVRAFHERADGSRAAISHMVKVARGDVARILLSAPVRPRTAADVVEIVNDAGLRTELTPHPGGFHLDVLERGAAA